MSFKSKNVVIFLKLTTNNNKITEWKVSKAKLWMLNLLHKFKSSWLYQYWLEIPLYLYSLVSYWFCDLLAHFPKEICIDSAIDGFPSKVHCSVEWEVFTPSIYYLPFYFVFYFFARLSLVKLKCSETAL